MSSEHSSGAPAAHRNTGPSRRSIIAGATWSVPAIVLATSVPAFAASNTPTLSFDRSSYSGVSCGTITGAYVTFTENGAPVAGAAVTVSLSAYYSFTADGSTTVTSTTDSSGRYDLPSISVPKRGGTGTASASATSSGQNASASASLVAAAVNEYGYFGEDWVTWNEANSIPPRSTLAPGNWFISADAMMMLPDGQGIKGSVQTPGPSIDAWFGYIKTDGTYGYARSDDKIYDADRSLPANCSPVGGKWFLHSDGRLFDYAGNVIATGIAAVGRLYRGNVGVKLQSGAFAYFDSNQQLQPANAAVPAGSDFASGAWFLTSDGRIVAGDSGQIVATGISSVGPPVGDSFGVALSAGGYGSFDTNGNFISASSAVPANCKLVGRDWFLASDGRLFNGSGNVILSDVAEVGYDRYNKGVAVRKRSC